MNKIKLTENNSFKIFINTRIDSKYIFKDFFEFRLNLIKIFRSCFGISVSIAISVVSIEEIFIHGNSLVEILSFSLKS